MGGSILFSSILLFYFCLSRTVFILFILSCCYVVGSLPTYRSTTITSCEVCIFAHVCICVCGGSGSIETHQVNPSMQSLLLLLVLRYYLYSPPQPRQVLCGALSDCIIIFVILWNPGMSASDS